MNFKLNQRAKIFLLSTAMTLPMAAYASQAVAQDEEDEGIDEIVVTATKRETNLMDTPIAISAFSEESLDRLGIKNVKDLNNLVPSLSIMVDVESSAPIITMRGVRSTNTTEWGDPAVGVHFDGVYSPRPQGALAMMFDIERAETLRGPQGTLFGRNSTVGSINVITKKPVIDEVSGKGVAEYGRWNQRAFKGVVNVPVHETLAIRLSGVMEKRDSFLEGYYDPNQWDTRYLQEMGGIPLVPTNVASTPAGNNPDFRFFFHDELYREVKADPSDFYNNINNYGMRISSLWKPSDDFQWHLTLEKYRDKSAGFLNTRDCERIEDRPSEINGGTCTDQWGSEDNFVAYVNVPGKNDMTIDSIRSHVTYDFLDAFQFNYNLGFQSQERSGQIDLDQGYYLWDQMLKWVDTDYDSWSHELQIKSIDDSDLQWIAGYFNFRENNYLNGQYHGAMGGVALWLQPKRIVSSDAFFAQGTYQVSEKLAITAGIRHTNDTKQDIGGRNYGCWSGCYPAEAWAMVRWDLIDWANFGNIDAQSQAYKDSTTKPREALNVLPSYYFDYPNENFNIDTINDVKNTWSNTTWRLGLDYDYSDDTLLYVYAANGYKGGGNGDVLIRQSDGSRFDTSYDAETVMTYEAGVKTKLLDGRMHVRANAYISDYNNQQFTEWTIYDTIKVIETDAATGLPREVDQDLGTFLTRNAAKSKIKGLELEMDYVPWEGGFISGFVTLMDTEIASDYWKAWTTERGQVFEGGDTNATGPLDPSKPWFRNFKGNDLPYSPKFAFTLNFSQEIMLENGGTVTPFFNVHYESSSYTSIDNTDKWEFGPGAIKQGIDLDIYSDKRDAWALANFSINYTSPEKDWFLEGFVNNVFNNDVNWWQGYAGGTPMANKALRTYGLRLGYNF